MEHRVLLEKLNVTQLIIQFRAIHGTLQPVTMSTVDHLVLMVMIAVHHFFL
jgi:hypothetical protein